MAYAPIKTEDLKKQIMAGKKRAMNIAYNPGPKGADLLIIDRLKAPDVIARVAKKEGEGNKVAFGSFVIDARKFKLTAEQDLPGLAKKLRKYLKTLDYSYAIEVYDEDGNITQSALEDEDDTPLGSAQTYRTSVSTPEDPPPPADTRTALADRLRALQPALATFGGAKGQLGRAMTHVVGAIKADDMDKAETMLTQIETAVSRAQDSGSQKEPPSPKALMARASSLKSVLVSLPPQASEVIKKTLVNAIELLQARDFAAAEVKIAAAERAVNTLSKEAPPKVAPQASKVPAPKPSSPPPAQQKEWQRRLAGLEQSVATAAQTGKGNASAATRSLDYAKAQAAAGRYDAALAAATSTSALLAEAPLAAPAAPDVSPLPPQQITACARSRDRWINTRHAIKADLITLKMAIDAQTRDIDGLEDVAGKTGGLLAHLDALDTVLETRLTALIDTNDATAQQKNAEEARKTISAYRHTLDNDFFRAVDDNGFVTTTIRQTALDALANVESALAA